MKAVKGPSIWAGMLSGQRDMLVLEGSSNVCCEPTECLVCAFTNELLSSPAEEKEGHSAADFYVLHKTYTWVQLKAPPCLWQSVGLTVSISCVCLCAYGSIYNRVCVSMSLGHVLSFFTG